MFKTLNGLFSNIECPSIKQGQKCELINCFFSHERQRHHDTLSPEAESARKKQKTGNETRSSNEAGVKSKNDNDNGNGNENENGNENGNGKDESRLLVAAGQDPRSNAPGEKLSTSKQESMKADSIRSVKLAETTAKEAEPQRLYNKPPSTAPITAPVTAKVTQHAREASTTGSGAAPQPPEARPNTEKLVLNPANRPKDAENLIVRPLVTSPATHPQRMSYLKTIYSTLISTSKHALPKKLAIHLEHKTASTSTTVSYPMNIRTLVKNIRAGHYSEESMAKRKRAIKKSTSELYRNELEKLIVPPEILKTRSYELTLPPTTGRQFDSAMRTTCDRCGSPFQINNKEPTICRFHQLRRLYDPVKKKRSDIFPCCSQPVGESNGCCQTTRHVFKIDDAEVLASIIPYTTAPPHHTSENNSTEGPATTASATAMTSNSTETSNTKSRLFAAAIDCEMAYTTFGMELIRLTVVDWDTGKTVLDRTTYPYGDVIDLNTRFSGVHSLEDGITVNNVKYDTITFKKARELLFDFVDSATILVGHGLENDLRCLRLCHTRVVDTALRYPDLKPTRTHSLRELAFTYLGRTIQTGEHDSSEDAIAAMDIVKQNIKRGLAR
ncbi:Rex3p [Sugiyamaella lignohabitans]|uniref:RNA exonuclease 3 n=1 Tax=Sugiyamaella lignohabitans TaxID=796027 RepID=A0A167F742_9ASCO|nr:Rex3p [Sugiyamaella lignohabitans]ANB14894.1 Rex3p [Sugiyamaella lignohabitans]